MKIVEVFQIIAWEIINPILLKRKKNKIYNFKEEFSGINLACGLDNLPHWIGIDGGITHILMNKLPKFLAKKFFSKFRMAKNYDFEEYYSKIKNIFFIHHDLRYGIPFRNNDIPYIYTSHFLEHLSKEEGENLFRECFRVLKAGGIIRIAVPSLEKSVKEIKASIRAYESGDYDIIQPYITSERVEYISPYSNHRFMYNFILLKESLEKTGFIKIQEFSFKVGNLPDVNKLDTRPSLFVEAIKPKF